MLSFYEDFYDKEYDRNIEPDGILCAFDVWGCITKWLRNNVKEPHVGIIINRLPCILISMESHEDFERKPEDIEYWHIKIAVDCYSFNSDKSPSYKKAIEKNINLVNRRQRAGMDFPVETPAGSTGMFGKYETDISPTPAWTGKYGNNESRICNLAKMVSEESKGKNQSQ